MCRTKAKRNISIPIVYRKSRPLSFIDLHYLIGCLVFLVHYSYFRLPVPFLYLNIYTWNNRLLFIIIIIMMRGSYIAHFYKCLNALYNQWRTFSCCIFKAQFAATQFTIMSDGHADRAIVSEHMHDNLA
jgi:hypothetical protein